MRKKSVKQSISFVVFLVSAVCMASLSYAATTERISVSTFGAQVDTNTYEEAVSKISDDGRYVVFLSKASTLVAGDTNNQSDVFLRDRQTGETTRVSVSAAGFQASKRSQYPVISADGRYVAFENFGSDLVAGDTNNTGDIFVRDLQTDTLELVSVSSSGIQGNTYSFYPSLSADGRYVAFQSASHNLVSSDTNSTTDIFVHDRVTGQTERVSVSSAGLQSNGPSEKPTISANGRYVAFSSNASNLVAGDTNGKRDIFVHDRQLGTTEVVSVSSSGEFGNNDAQMSEISADGQHVVFQSMASNLVANDTNLEPDTFVHDRTNGTTTMVSVSSSGEQADGALNEGVKKVASISGNGRYVVFRSHANNLVVGDTNPWADIFLHDRVTGETERVSISDIDAQATGESAYPTISADGKYVGFYSGASNLVTGDTNGKYDHFVRIRDIDLPFTTQIILRGDQNTDGMYTSDVEVTLKKTNDTICPDPNNCSEEEVVEYSLDNIIWDIYTGPFVVSSEGTIVYMKELQIQIPRD